MTSSILKLLADLRLLDNVCEIVNLDGRLAGKGVDIVVGGWDISKGSKYSAPDSERRVERSWDDSSPLRHSTRSILLALSMLEMGGVNSKGPKGLPTMELVVTGVVSSIATGFELGREGVIVVDISVVSGFVGVTNISKPLCSSAIDRMSLSPPISSTVPDAELSTFSIITQLVVTRNQWTGLWAVYNI